MADVKSAFIFCAEKGTARQNERSSMERYGIITEKNPREIVMLRGSGCRYKKCTFCDYHLDFSKNQQENLELNRSVLNRVSGSLHRLEVINSGSFQELDKKTVELIISTCREKNIHTVHCESHYIYKSSIKAMKKLFSDNGIQLKVKTGAETFDIPYREEIMKKGFGNAAPAQIAEYADEVCLLFGLEGQSEQSMLNDIETGLEYFERVCVNIMTKNTTPILPDNEVISVFKEKIYPKYADNPRVDILIKNTDFGVGSEIEEVK